MSREVHFKPTKEAMEKYKPKEKWQSDIINDTLYNMQLKLYTMAELSDEDKDNDTMVYKILQHYKFVLASWKRFINEDTDKEAYEIWQEDGDDILWYGGLGMYDKPNQTYEQLVDYVINELMILKYLAPAGKYYDEKNHIYDKLNDIDSVLDYFRTTCYEFRRYEIMEDLREFELNYDCVESDEEDELSCGFCVSEYGEMKQFGFKDLTDDKDNVEKVEEDAEV